MAEAVAFHEAVPGHHFQLTIAQEQTGMHLVYSVTRDVTNSEGWGLYTERLADEMGLYSDDVARLGMLTADAMRATRHVVDTAERPPMGSLAAVSNAEVDDKGV